MQLDFNLEAVERSAAYIQEALDDYVSFLDFLVKGGEISDPHDTFPDEIYEAAVRPEAMRPLLAAIAQLRPMQERIAELERKDQLRTEAALQAMVDDAQALGLYDESPKPKFNPVSFAAGKLLKRKR